MDQPLSAAEVRQRMQVIRQNLRPEVDGIFTNAKDLADWRYYVKAFPWGSLAMVTALGYMAVPRRLEIISPDEKTIEKLARKNRLVVEHKPTSETKPGLAESLFNLTGNVVLRAGLAYLGQQAGKLFGEQAAEPPPQTGGGTSP